MATRAELFASGELKSPLNVKEKVIKTLRDAAEEGGGGGGGDSWKKVLYTDNVSFTMGSWDHGQINGTALLQQFPNQAVNIKELTVNEKTYTNVAIFPRANAETPGDVTTKKIESNLPDGINIDIIVGVEWNDNDEFIAKITMDTNADPLPTVTASAIIEGFTFSDELYSAYMAINL